VGAGVGVREREYKVAPKGMGTLEKLLKRMFVAVCCSALQFVAVASHINTYTLNAHICIYVHVCAVCV